MADTVDDPSTADGLTPSTDPSDHGDEIDIHRTFSHLPLSLQGTASDTKVDISTWSEGADGPTTMNITIYGEANLDFLPQNARDVVHQASDATFNGFAFKSTGIELSSSEKRIEIMKQRFPRPALERSQCYTPHVKISNPLIMTRLTKIAQEFIFIDQVFAECFRAFEETFDHNTIWTKLEGIRNDLTKSQCQYSGPITSQAYQIGPLGEFCEHTCNSWGKPASNRESKGYKNGIKSSTDYPKYLQDTLEIPYWELIIDLLIDWRADNTSNILGTAILYMLRYKALFFRKKVDELDQMKVPAEDKEGLSTVMRSIQKRLKCLNERLDVVMPDEGPEIISSATIGVQGVHSERDSGTSTAILSTEHDAPKQLALFVFFIILAFIPGYQGFAISAQSHENGSTNDSDFYYLMQGSIMSVLGNFATALPLLQSTRISGTSYFFWAFSAVGLFSAVLSVAIYPFTNTGWSSVISFIGTVASAASVLVLTVATAREQMTGPVSRKSGDHTMTGDVDWNEKKKQ